MCEALEKAFTQLLNGMPTEVVRLFCSQCCESSVFCVILNKLFYFTLNFHFKLKLNLEQSVEKRNSYVQK